MKQYYISIRDAMILYQEDNHYISIYHGDQPSKRINIKDYNQTLYPLSEIHNIIINDITETQPHHKFYIIAVGIEYFRLINHLHKITFSSTSLTINNHNIPFTDYTKELLATTINNHH